MDRFVVEGAMNKGDIFMLAPLWIRWRDTALACESSTKFISIHTTRQIYHVSKKMKDTIGDSFKARKM